MIQCAVENIQEGMVVARPIIIQGKVLLTVGTKVLEKHIKIFQAWGVSEIWIEGEKNGSNKVDDPVEQGDEHTHQTRKIIEKRFEKYLQTDDFIKELKKVVIKYQVLLVSQQEKTE